MRSFGIRVPILAATIWAGIGLSVWARDHFYSETVYLAPTTATVTWPTTYVSSRSYVVPTAYYAPTYYPTAYFAPSYYPTAYTSPTYYSTAYYGDGVALAPTTYLSTAYTVRRGLFGRLRLVERPVVASYGTTYLPTSYYLPSYYTTSYRAASYYTPTVYSPTVYDYPRVWESGYVSSRDVCCDQVAWAQPVSPAPSRSYSAPSSSGGSKAVRSDPMDDPTIPSNVDLAPAEEPKAPFKPPLDNSKTQAPAAPRDNSPTPPSVPREKSTAQPATGAGTATPKAGANAPASPKAAPPAAPSGDQNEPALEPAPGADNSSTTTRRDAYRPVYSTRTLRPDLRNVLIGRVESDAGEPLGEVPVTVTSRDNSAVRRDGMTNAFGNFAIRLPEGEWTVNVRMPSGRVYPVRSVTVSNGRIVDNQEGREVRNLIISY